VPDRASDRRGVTIRRALMAVVRICFEDQVALPSYAALAAAVGISAGQISRHMARLMDDNLFVPMRDGRRIYVEQIHG
jgi:DNA-binding transcriptional ArsR family regulator